MSDKVVVMNKGEILQQGSPIDIYNEPANAFVADFIGESNIFPGIMKRDRYIEFFNTAYDCVDEGFAPDEPVDVVLRPEDLLLLNEGDKSIQKADCLLRGRVISCLFKGIYYEIMIDVEGAVSYQFMAKSTIPEDPGREIFIDIDPENIHIMKKSSIETITMQKHRFMHDPNKNRKDAPDEDD